jgi:hypothetical protein
MAEARPDQPRPAWYAAGPGWWHDWVTILHPPYTAWHLSYVLIGAGLAPHVNGQRLVATLLAFALAVGLAAHAFDELRGRPLGTRISTSVLSTVGALSLGAAAALGVLGIQRIGWGLAPFIGVGVFLVVAYNFELWGGRFHNDVTFAAAWGAFPVLTAYYAQAETIRPAAIAGAAFAYGLSHAQRTLSTEAREIRRRVASVAGERVYADGSRLPINRASLLRPLERALITLSWSTCALGVAMVIARAGY